MIETKPASAQFLDVFINETGEFRWRNAGDLDSSLTEKRVDNGIAWLSAGFDCYDEPLISVGFRGEEQKTPHATIGSTAIHWVNESENGYEMPLEEVDGLQVEIEFDEVFGLRRYFVPDSLVSPVTVSFWRTELRDTADPDSQGGWSEPEPVQETDDFIMRRLVKESVHAAREL